METSRSTIASATSGGRSRISAVARNSLRVALITFSGASRMSSPTNVTGVAAPMTPPGEKRIVSHAIAMTAPAENASRETYATVGMVASRRIPLDATAASRYPPGVARTMTTTPAPASVAS
jgi:hypothetical protein